MMNRALGCFACAVLALVGCSESHTEETDASIVIDLDGAMLDGGPGDGGSGVGNVGAECGADTDCTGDGATCLSDPDFLPNGYCSFGCTPGGDECPMGSSCTEVGGGQAFCLDECEPGATPRECRAGYGCGSLGLGSPPVCIGGCTDDTDCPSGLMCDPSGGATGAGGCFSPGAGFGDACGADTDCPMGGFCLAEEFNGWPQGSCIGFGCDLASNTGCGGDAECIPSGMNALCVDGCATTADCRAGYECRGQDGYPDRMVCAPACTTDAQCTGGNVCNVALGTCDAPFDPDLLGQMCSRRTGGCDGGTCLTEGETGFPFAYCALVGCTVGDDASCPAGGACAPGAGGDNLCLDACAADTDCRAGYACRHVDGADPASSLACLPACTADSQCANAMRLGFVCNDGTGLCGDAFAGTVGEPCVDTDADCAGGRCLSEGDGWPGGACVAVGCSLDATVAGETCPAGSTCVDDAAGRAEVGYCLDACVVGGTGGTSCRAGYECTPAAAGVTEGVCRPMASVPPV